MEANRAAEIAAPLLLACVAAAVMGLYAFLRKRKYPIVSGQGNAYERMVDEEQQLPSGGGTSSRMACRVRDPAATAYLESRLASLAVSRSSSPLRLPSGAASPSADAIKPEHSRTPARRPMGGTERARDYVTQSVSSGSAHAASPPSQLRVLHAASTSSATLPRSTVTNLSPKECGGGEDIGCLEGPCRVKIKRMAARPPEGGSIAVDVRAASEASQLRAEEQTSGIGDCGDMLGGGGECAADTDTANDNDGDISQRDAACAATPLKAGPAACSAADQIAAPPLGAAKEPWGEGPSVAQAISGDASALSGEPDTPCSSAAASRALATEYDRSRCDVAAAEDVATSLVNGTTPAAAESEAAAGAELAAATFGAKSFDGCSEPTRGHDRAVRGAISTGSPAAQAAIEAAPIGSGGAATEADDGTVMLRSVCASPDQLALNGRESPPGGCRCEGGSECAALRVGCTSTACAMAGPGAVREADGQEAGDMSAKTLDSSCGASVPLSVASASTAARIDSKTGALPALAAGDESLAACSGLVTEGAAASRNGSERVSGCGETSSSLWAVVSGAVEEAGVERGCVSETGEGGDEEAVLEVQPTDGLELVGLRRATCPTGVRLSEGSQSKRVAPGSLPATASEACTPPDGAASSTPRTSATVPAFLDEAFALEAASISAGSTTQASSGPAAAGMPTAAVTNQVPAADLEIESVAQGQSDAAARAASNREAALRVARPSAVPETEEMGRSGSHRTLSQASDEERHEDEIKMPSAGQSQGDGCAHPEEAAPRACLPPTISEDVTSHACQPLPLHSEGADGAVPDTARPIVTPVRCEATSRTSATENCAHFEPPPLPSMEGSAVLLGAAPDIEWPLFPGCRSQATGGCVDAAPSGSAQPTRTPPRVSAPEQTHSQGAEPWVSPPSARASRGGEDRRSGVKVGSASDSRRGSKHGGHTSAAALRGSHVEAGERAAHLSSVEAIEHAKRALAISKAKERAFRREALRTAVESLPVLETASDNRRSSAQRPSTHTTGTRRAVLAPKAAVSGPACRRPGWRP